MQSRLELLTPKLIERILDEAFQLLIDTGIKVSSAEVRQLLSQAGAKVSESRQVVKISESIIRDCLESVPSHFDLFNLNGEPVVSYGGDEVHFDPGSSGVSILDPETLEHKSSTSMDLVRLVKITEMLPQYDAQSTALVCNDIPKDVGDIYRLYVVLIHSEKPIVTGAFSVRNSQAMFDMLAVFTEGREGLKQKPIAVFDVCPTPPLIWSKFASQSLLDLARAGVPAQIVSMPLAGAAGPVTLLGSVVQHAAECLSGIAIHQLAQAGAPIVWGGAPAIFDMRYGTTPMGAIETAMIDASYAQVGKSLGLPTHTYLGASDAKIVDAQAGLESGMTALVGALAGINMISGAGMLDFLACQSLEKLVIDAEAIAMVKRLLRGVQEQTPTLALEMFAGIDFKADFLKQKITKQLFREEQHLPSPVIDRASSRSESHGGQADAFYRARDRVSKLLGEYQLPSLHSDERREIQSMMAFLSQQVGLEQLPSLDG